MMDKLTGKWTAEYVDSLLTPLGDRAQRIADAHNAATAKLREDWTVRKRGADYAVMIGKKLLCVCDLRSVAQEIANAHNAEMREIAGFQEQQ